MPCDAKVDLPFTEVILRGGAFVPVEVLWSAGDQGHGATSSAGLNQAPPTDSVGDDGPSDAIWDRAAAVEPGFSPVVKVVAPPATKSKQQAAQVNSRLRC